MTRYPQPQARRKRFIDYPRAARRGWTRWIPSWRVVSSVVLLGIGGLAVAFLAMYANAEVTPPNATTQAQTTIVYYNDGKTEIGRFQKENRTIVPLSSVPQTVRYAVLAAEDRSFYTNTGVSVTGILRAAWNNSQGGSLQGGSTITQQYVKNAILNNQQRTASRKLNEFFIALKISRQLSKDDILGNYLNTIYFGRNYYGIEAASQGYFHKNVGKLNPSEGAFLAGIINGPSLYDPATGPTATALAKERWTFVADGMAKEGWVTPEARAAMKFPVVQPPKTVTKKAPDDQTGYLLQMVRNELVNVKHLYTDTQLDTGGLRIITTFDRHLISDAVRSVHSTLPARSKWPTGTQVALVSIDPRTGAVVSIYGGDGKRSQNAVTQDVAQAGSTFKPFTLITGLTGTAEHEPFSLKSRFDGRSPLKLDGYTVRNFGNEQFGKISLLTATEHSVNTVYVQLNADVGAKNTLATAVKAGLPSGTGGLGPEISNVLGPSSPHPIDMASAYATIAAQGTRHPWFVVQQVRNSNGPIFTYRPAGTRAFDADVMADTTYAMQQVVKRGTAARANSLDRPAAGKTGTSDDSQSAWFVGFTPQLTTAVAMYRIDPEPPNGPLPLKGFAGVSTSAMTGGGLPTRIWTNYMTDALDGKPVLDFPDPAYGGVTVDPEPSQTPTPTNTPTTAPTTTATLPTNTPTPTKTHRPRPTFPTPTTPTVTVTGPTTPPG